MTYPVYTIDPFALTSVAACKEHLNIKDLDTSQDNILTRLINSGSEMIETYLDRAILQRTYTVYFDGRANDRILLGDWPVAKPAELWDDASSLFTNVANKIPTTDYDVEGDPAVGVVLLNGRKFAKGNRNIKVVYDGGFPTVPYAIAEAAILYVEYMYDMRGDRRIGVKSKGKSQENIEFLGDLPEFVKNMLEPYRDTALCFTASQGIQNT